MSDQMRSGITRRGFVDRIGVAGAVLGLGGSAAAAEQAGVPVDAAGRVIPGFEPGQAEPSGGVWQPVSDRRIRVGIAGYGTCRFGAEFGFQDHPNVEVAAVTDLIPARRDALAKACRCPKTYDSCEAMLDDDTLEAVYIATDAPSHARLAIAALERGRHVACAVPAVWGSLEDADRLLDAVRRTGRKYMMFETSCFHADLYAWHRRYRAGRLGRIVYSEGEYYHHFPAPLAGYNPKTRCVDADGWRKGLPPLWYPTHATAYHVGVTGGRFTELSAMGMHSAVPQFQAAHNDYRNPFGTEIALMRTSDGGMSRVAVGWDTAPDPPAYAMALADFSCGELSLWRRTRRSCRAGQRDSILGGLR